MYAVGIPVAKVYRKVLLFLIVEAFTTTIDPLLLYSTASCINCLIMYISCNYEGSNSKMLNSVIYKHMEVIFICLYISSIK